MSISQSCSEELFEKRALEIKIALKVSASGRFREALHKTSHSGFVYCRYFPIKEKVGGKRGSKFVMWRNVPIILQA